MQDIFSSIALAPFTAAAASDNFDFIIPDWVVELTHVGNQTYLHAVPASENKPAISVSEYLQENGYDFETPITLTIPNTV